MVNGAIRKRKHQLFGFIDSHNFTQWTIRISQKALTMGTEHFAEVSPFERVMIINPHKTVVQFVESVIHEILHVLYPHSRESTILKWEQQIMNDMSPSEMTRLLKTLFTSSNVVWDE